MGDIKDDADEVFRDYVTDGDPESGANEPVKSDIRAWAALIDALVGDAGVRFTLDWDSLVTTADPGAGKLRFNNATRSSVTEIAISDSSSASGNPDVSAWLATFDDGTSTIKGHLFVRYVGKPQKYSIYAVTAAVDATTHWRFTVEHVSSADTMATGGALSVMFLPKGDKGETGDAGADGTDPGILYTFDDTTTDSDPGAGLLRADNADLSAATSLFLDDVDRSANNVEAHLLTWDDSTNTTKGHLYLTRASDGAQTIFAAGAVTDASGYVKVAVAYVSGATSFTAGDAISAQFYRAGDIGTIGVDGVAAGIRWAFNTGTTTTTDEGAGAIWFNHATLASVTEVALSDQSTEIGNPDVSGELATWDDSTSAVRGKLIVKKTSAPENFAIYDVTAGVDATTHWRFTVTHRESDGSFSAADVLSVQFIPKGDVGAGSTVAIEQDGSSVHASAETINFTGGLTATDAGGGQVDVQIGGSGWTVADTWEQSVDGSVASVDFTGLAGASEILVVFSGVTASSASSVRIVRLSVDNGASFYATSGDYAGLNGTGELTNDASIASHATASSSARSGSIHILVAGVTASPKLVRTSRTDFPQYFFLASASPVTAVRAMLNTGSMTGGKVIVLTR